MIEEDKKPIGIAVDLLFQKRNKLLDKYNGEIIVMSQSFNIDNHNDYCKNLDQIHEQLKFIVRLLSLTRDQTRFAIEDIPTYPQETASE